MEAGIIVIVILGVLASGVVIGTFIERSRIRKVDSQGTIYVYLDSTANKPSLLLEYAVPIEDIVSRKQVLFDVTIVR